MNQNRKKKPVGKLTLMLKSKPVNTKKLKKYGLLKSIDGEKLCDLAEAYSGWKMSDGVNLFHIACSVSTPDIVEHLVREGWDVNCTSSMHTPISRALYTANFPVVRKLIELGADFKSYQEGGTTPMLAALDKNKGEESCLTAVKLLLDAGVSVNEPLFNVSQQKGLHFAVSENFQSVVTFLLQNGADVDSEDANGVTPLLTAVFMNYFEIIKLLVLHGADIYRQSIAPLNSPLVPFYLAVQNNLKPVVEFFVKSGCDINRSFNNTSFTALYMALNTCNKDMVSFLIGLGANVNLVGGDGLTPLHFLAGVDWESLKIRKSSKINTFSLKSRVEMIEFLVENGADVNANTLKNSPLACSIDMGSVELANTFLKLGANPNVQSSNSPMVLYDAVYSNSNVIVNLLEHGADYAVCNESGLTPYHEAISSKVDVNFIRSFVKHGCPYNQNKPIWKTIIKDCSCVTKMFFKAEILYFKGILENNLNVVRRAIERGAVVRSCSEEIKYPLHFLALHDYKELVTLLLEKQFPPNLLNDYEETALHIAAKHGHYDVCCMLLRFGAVYNCFSKKCPSTPKALAELNNHDNIVKLFQRVGRMFNLASIDDKRVVTVLKRRLRSNINEYLMFVKAINNRGESLLATALRKNCWENAKIMMDLQLSCDWLNPL